MSGIADGGSVISNTCASMPEPACLNVPFATSKGARFELTRDLDQRLEAPTFHRAETLCVRPGGPRGGVGWGFAYFASGGPLNRASRA